jgi:hypothetical protein
MVLRGFLSMNAPIATRKEPTAMSGMFAPSVLVDGSEFGDELDASAPFPMLTLPWPPVSAPVPGRTTLPPVI